MTYNKSAILKRAWTRFKHDHTKPSSRRLYHNFQTALKESWAMEKDNAKREAELRSQGFVSAAELQCGNMVAVNGYGGYEDNNILWTIVAMKKSDNYIVFYDNRGRDFCAKPHEMVRVVA